MPRHLLRTILFAAACVAAAPSPAAVDLAAPIPTGPQVKVGKLANGLTYYIQRNGKPAQRVELRLVVKAGSVLEDEDQRGLAHFTEHLAFNGSTHFQPHELVSWLQSIGVKFGADLNAYTSYDETTYILPVPTGRLEDVDKAFDILEDWAHGLTLADADIEKERPIVLEELRMRKGVGQRVNQALMPRLFPGTRYADHDPIGREETIRTFKPEALRRFYRDWYRPDLMAVVAVGDIDPDDIERRIRTRFGPLVNPQHERARTYDDLHPVPGNDAIVVTDGELTTSNVSLHYPPHYAPDPGTYGSYRDKMVERMAGMMMGQRLAERAQAPMPPFMSGSSGQGWVTPRYKAYTAAAALGAGGSSPAIAALVAEQKRVRRDGFTPAELEWARKIVRRGYERMYEQRDTTNSNAFADEAIRNFLMGGTLPGAVAEYRFALELLPGIGLSDVNALARRTIPEDAGKLVVYVGPGEAGNPAPSPKMLLADVDRAEHADVAAHTEKRLAARLMAPPAQSGRIVDESSDAALGLTRLTLSNGVKVILKPTDFNRDQVLLRAARYGGQHLFAPQDLASARYASTLVPVMGIEDLTPLDLGKVTAGRNASVGLSLGSDTDEISGSAGASRDDIETMLQLLWLRFAGVRRDDDLYRSYMGKQRELLHNRLAQPEARFGDAITDALYGAHPYAPHALTLDDLDHVDLERSLAIYRARFSSAKGLTFVLVGSFDVAAIKPLLATYLGTLPTPDLPLAYRDVGLRYAAGVVKKEVDAGAEQKSQVSLTFTGPATWSAAEQVRLRALVEVMNLRIVDVLREQRGLIYSGAMGGSLQRIPYESYAIGANLPTGPDKVNEAVAALFAEIERIKKEGPSQADLDKVKRNWQEAYRRGLRENGYWLRELEWAEFNGQDPHRILRYVDESDALTPADIQAAAQRYFNMANYVQVVLNPAHGALAHAGAAGPAGGMQ